ncbi:MAG: GcrA family cell cycle regulator [Pseudomonadota bacterium]
MSWTEERVELLKKLWGDGQSASQIAKELGGVTRNAVIGKVHRLGLSNRAGARTAAPKENGQEQPQPAPKKSIPPTAKVDKTLAPAAAAQARPPQPAKLPQIIPAEKQLPPQPSANEISPEALASHRDVMKKALRLSLMQLTEKTCKWPFGDPASDDFWFCGLPVEPGKCYCAPCAKIAYQPASARRDRRR